MNFCGEYLSIVIRNRIIVKTKEDVRLLDSRCHPKCGKLLTEPLKISIISKNSQIFGEFFAEGLLLKEVPCRTVFL